MSVDSPTKPMGWSLGAFLELSHISVIALNIKSATQKEKPYFGGSVPIQ